MGKFTKGPWRTEYSRSALFHNAVDKDRNCFANCMQEHRTLYGPNHSSEFIADIAVKSDDEGQANISLIAAAPDMLEALEAAMRIVDLWFMEYTEDEHAGEAEALGIMRDNFEQAITKATKGERGKRMPTYDDDRAK